MLALGRPRTHCVWLADVGLDTPKPFYSTRNGSAFLGDSLGGLKRMPSGSVDLVLTSPPFALTRKKEYGNEPIERYLDWFLPFCHEIKRVLRDDGSFILDIGGAWIPGSPVRSVYHFEVAVHLSRLFYLAQDFYWYNPAKLPTPAEWVTVRRIRVKDAVNTIWWFSKSENPDADNRRVLRPYSESMRDLLKRGYRPKKRPSGHDISSKFGRDNGGSIPPNLLEIANTESNSSYLRLCRFYGIKPHPARFPERVVEFFVDFLIGDRPALILDPFAGSNVTGAVAERRGLRWIAFEKETEYIRGSMLRFIEGPLFTNSAIETVLRAQASPKISEGDWFCA